MRGLIFISLVVIFICSADAQKVGVVLSGGGAKGLAHIGVLKALEENNIPIDYIAGTSMGGIIAGGYAAGISPHQLEDIVLSEDFLKWIQGAKIRNHNDYGEIKKDPSFVKLNLSLDSTFISLLNYNIAKDWSLNFATSEIMAQASAISHFRFDSLFVPLRVVAADIFTQSEIPIDSGLLSDALRVTQTVPFFYRPIKFKNKYLFDGGLYNNFPIDVMRKEFAPDIVIGSNVSARVYDKYPYKDDDKLISKALLFILLNKSDVSKLSEKDVYIEPNVKSYTAFDFAEAKHLIDSGYMETMRNMETIKSKIVDRRSCPSVFEKRNAFNNRAKPLLFDRISFKNFRKGQERYISAFFYKRKKRRLLFANDIKRGYYGLMSDPYFNNIYPRIVYDTVTHHFNFELTKRSQPNIQIDFGGVVATRNVSSIFLGINHFYFRDLFIHSHFSFYSGNFYKSAEAKFRISLPSFQHIYFEPQFLYNSWYFSREKGLLDDTLNPTILYNVDYKAGLSANIFLSHNYRASVHGYYVYNKNRYINGKVVTSLDTLDNLQLAGTRLGVSFSTYTLNRPQYASIGKSFRFSLDYFSLVEHFSPGSTSVETQNQSSLRSWFRFRATMEQYFRLGKMYTIGYYIDGVLSDQPVLANYQASLINAPAFNPMQDSKSLFLRNFRSFNFVGLGCRNVISLYKNLDLRLSGYFFHPFTILSNLQQQGFVGFNFFSSFFFAANTSVVYHSALGPISVSVNYYDDVYSDTKNQFGILFHMGFLLFNRAALE